MGSTSKSMLFLSGLALLAGCAARPPAPPPKPVVQAVPDYTPNVTALRGALLSEVPGAILPDSTGDAAWIARAQAALAASPYRVTSPQLLVAVDRNPAIQQMRIIFAAPDAPWQVIGGGKVSTGRTGRDGYFITPTGVFPHTTAILDYRALGTYNENHIRGLGLKGSRVWDFGWQTAVEGWRTDGTTGEIRLLMHATDPAYLEPRLGHPDSKGCVRISAAMNGFLDRHAVLDEDYLQIAATDRAFAAMLPADSAPARYPGTYLVIFDSSLTNP